MQSKPKSNSVVTTGYDAVAKAWTFDVAGIGQLRMSRDTLHAAILEKALIEGVSDRIADKAALPFNKELNRYASPQEKYEAMAGLISHYETGTADWSMRVSDGTGGQTALAVEAFARANSCSHDQAKERIERRAADAGRTYAKQLAIVAQLFPEEYAAVKAERDARVTPAFNADDELAGLKGE